MQSRIMRPFQWHQVSWRSAAVFGICQCVCKCWITSVDALFASLTHGYVGQVGQSAEDISYLAHLGSQVKFQIDL